MTSKDQAGDKPHAAAGQGTSPAASGSQPAPPASGGSPVQTLNEVAPDFSRRDLERAAAPADLARGREFAGQVKELDWDEYSVWGSLPGEGINAGYLLLHYGEGPLAGECPCPDGKGGGLCAHMVALGWAALGDAENLAERLAAVPHEELVAMAVDLADRSAWAREAIWIRLSR